jgi:hypothetical protein
MRRTRPQTPQGTSQDDHAQIPTARFPARRVQPRETREPRTIPDTLPRLPARLQHTDHTIDTRPPQQPIPTVLTASRRAPSLTNASSIAGSNLEAHAIINALSPFCTSADGRRTIAPSHGEREGRGCGVRLSLNHIDQGGQQNLLSQPRPRSAFPPLRTPTQHRHPATHDTRPSPHRTPFLTTQVPPGPASWKPGSPRPHQTLYHGSPPVCNTRTIRSTHDRHNSRFLPY